MPSKKKKYNARFPAVSKNDLTESTVASPWTCDNNLECCFLLLQGRIKKIMQTDEEVGKVAQAVPVIISRTLELFIQSLLTKTVRVTNARNAKTLSPSHMKQVIESENRFDFLKELVKNVPDISLAEEREEQEAAALQASDCPPPPTEAMDYSISNGRSDVLP